MWTFLAGWFAGIASKVVKAFAALAKDWVWSCWADNKKAFLEAAEAANKHFPAPVTKETLGAKLERQGKKFESFVAQCEDIVKTWCATNSKTYDDSGMNFLTELAVRAVKLEESQ